MTSSEILIPMSTSTLYDDLCCIPAQYFFSFRCLTQFDVLECISAVFRMQSVLMIWILYSWKLWLLNLYYTHLFNTVLTKSTFPEHWKQTKILPIPKTHNEFRPIVILPFLSKVMKNIMARKITYYLESQNYFILSQSGLMKGRSCTTAPVNVVEDLRSKQMEIVQRFWFFLITPTLLTQSITKFYWKSSGNCFIFQILPVI